MIHHYYFYLADVGVILCQKESAICLVMAVVLWVATFVVPFELLVLYVLLLQLNQLHHLGKIGRRNGHRLLELIQG